MAGGEVYSPDQVELFGEVLTRLVEEIEATARAELSQRCAAPDRAAAIAAPAGAGPGDRGGATAADRLRGVATKRSRSNAPRPAARAICWRSPSAHRGAGNRAARGTRRRVGAESVAESRARTSPIRLRMLVDRSEGNDDLAGDRRTADLPRHHFLRLLQVASELVRQQLQAAIRRTPAPSRRSSPRSRSDRAETSASRVMTTRWRRCRSCTPPASSTMPRS